MNKGRPVGSINSRPQHKWTKEEKDYLRKIVTSNGYRQITDMMNEKFEYKFTQTQIEGAIRRYRLNTGLKGYFPKGHTPWNKGKKGLNIGGKQTQFKKGNIPTNHRILGSERITKDGYFEVKVKEPNRWKLKHRVIYEQYYNVQLNSEDVIIFLDGNKQNLNIENLYKVTRSQLARINQNNLIKEDAELTKVGINIAKIIAKCGELNGR